MECSQWLQGGPFLEVSFILELKENKSKAIREIINGISKVTNKIEIADKNVDDIIEFFESGYALDEGDSLSHQLHSLRLRLYVYISRKRKATLQIEKVSSDALMINFWFFGEQFDESEWDQVGIKKEEYPEFTRFFEELYEIFEFKIGAIGMEEDVLGLFECGEPYPNECYRYENVSSDFLLKKPARFINIIWNEKFNELRYIPYSHKRLNKEGILIETGNFNK